MFEIKESTKVAVQCSPGRGIHSESYTDNTSRSIFFLKNMNGLVKHQFNWIRVGARSCNLNEKIERLDRSTTYTYISN